MAGLLDALKNWGNWSEDPNKNAAVNQGLLQAAFSLMNSRGSLGQALGQAGLTGLQGFQQDYANRQESAMRKQMFDMQMADRKRQEEAAKQAAARQQQQQAFIGALPDRLAPQPAVTMPSLTLAGEFNAMNGGAGATRTLPARPGGLTPQLAAEAASLGVPMEQLNAIANAGRAKIKDYKEVTGPDGRPMLVGLDEMGNVVDTGRQGYRTPEIRDLGDRQEVIDPVTQRTLRSLPKGQSPDSRASTGLGYSQLAFQRQQSMLPTFDSSLGAFVDRRTQTVSQATGPDGKPLVKPSNATPTGEERKAATLLTRMDGSLAQLQRAVSGDKGAAKPEIDAEFVRRIPLIGNDGAANMFTSEPRQRVEAAQLDILDAALTLGTGAAYTREQLEGYRRAYFPQIGDDPQTVRDKQERLNNVIQAARIAAGRAAQLVPQEQGLMPQGAPANDPLGLRR